MSLTPEQARAWPWPHRHPTEETVQCRCTLATGGTRHGETDGKVHPLGLTGTYGDKLVENITQAAVRFKDRERLYSSDTRVPPQYPPIWYDSELVNDIARAYGMSPLKAAKDLRSARQSLGLAEEEGVPGGTRHGETGDRVRSVWFDGVEVRAEVLRAADDLWRRCGDEAREWLFAAVRKDGLGAVCFAVGDLDEGVGYWKVMVRRGHDDADRALYVDGGRVPGWEPFVLERGIGGPRDLPSVDPSWYNPPAEPEARCDYILDDTIEAMVPAHDGDGDLLRASVTRSGGVYRGSVDGAEVSAKAFLGATGKPPVNWYDEEFERRHGRTRDLPPRRVEVGQWVGSPRFPVLYLEENGVRIEDVISYDLDEGWAWQYVLRDDGTYETDGSELRMRRVDGRIRAEWSR